MPDASPLAARLYHEHGGAVRRYVRRLTGRAEEADDLVQETFLRVVRGASSYEPRERERAWIFRIAHNVVQDHRRVAVRSREEAGRAEAPLAPTQALVSELERALAALPDEEREAFLLGEVGGLSYAEIARATDATVAAVRSRIYRARLALRTRLLPPAPLGPGAHLVREDDE